MQPLNAVIKLRFQIYCCHGRVTISKAYNSSSTLVWRAECGVVGGVARDPVRPRQAAWGGGDGGTDAGCRLRPTAPGACLSPRTMPAWSSQLPRQTRRVHPEAPVSEDLSRDSLSHSFPKTSAVIAFLNSLSGTLPHSGPQRCVFNNPEVIIRRPNGRDIGGFIRMRYRMFGCSEPENPFATCCVDSVLAQRLQL